MVPEGWVGKWPWGSLLLYGADLAEGKSCRYFALPKVKVVSLAALSSPWGPQELRLLIRRKAVLGLRGSLVGKSLARIQKV